MSSVNFVYRLSEKGRRAAVLAGLAASQYQVVPLPVEAVPVSLADHIFVGVDGKAWLSLVRDTGVETALKCPREVAMSAVHQGYNEEYLTEQYPDLDSPITDPSLWLRELAARLPEEYATAKAKYDAAKATAEAQAQADHASHVKKVAGEIAKLESLAVAELSKIWRSGEIEGTGGLHGDGYRVPEELRQRMDSLREKVGVYRDKLELDKKMQMRLWIDEHGSQRLKNCVKEGIKCDGAYYSERLQGEHPNWVKYSAVAGECKDPINPPAEAFALLEEARKEIPTATLQFYVDDGIKLYCAYAEWPSHPDVSDLVYFGGQDYETQPDAEDGE